MTKLTSCALILALWVSVQGKALSQEAPNLSTDVLPDIARQLIDQAAKKGDPAGVMAVADATKAVLPSFSSGIDDYSNQVLQGLAANSQAPAITQDGDATQVAQVTPETAPTTDAAAGVTPEEAPKVRTGIFALEPWEGTISASAVNATGNSQNTAVGISFKAKRTSGRLDKYTHNVAGYFDVGSTDIDVTDEDGNTTSESLLTQRRWGVAYQVDYALSDRFNVFSRFAYDEDDFSGFDYRLFTSAGIGYFVTKLDHFTWKVDAGPGYRLSPIDDTNETLSEFALFGSSDIDWIIRDGLKFTSDIIVTYTDPTTSIEATHGLNADIWGGFVAGVEHYYRFESSPPVGNVRSDNVLRATLGYSF